MTLTPDDVSDILALLDASSFTALSLKTENFSLELRRLGEGGWVQEIAVAGEAALAAPIAKPIAAMAAGTGVASPLVGTFYRAPKPGAPPYVEMGSEVEPETVVGLIETMKLMNSVYAGMRGRVVEILAGDAQFVEQGAPLMRIDPQK